VLLYYRNGQDASKRNGTHCCQRAESLLYAASASFLELNSPKTADPEPLISAKSAPDSRSAANASPIMGYLDAIGAVKLFRNGHPDTGPRYKAGRSAARGHVPPAPDWAVHSSTRAYASTVELATPGQIRTPKRSSRAGIGLTISPLPFTSAAGPERKKGTSLPMRAAMQASAAWDSPASKRLSNPRRTAAASEEPPPSPAPAGTRFVRVTRRPEGTPVSRRNSSIARVTVFIGGRPIRGDITSLTPSGPDRSIESSSARDTR